MGIEVSFSAFPGRTTLPRMIGVDDIDGRKTVVDGGKAKKARPGRQPRRCSAPRPRERGGVLQTEVGDELAKMRHSSRRRDGVVSLLGPVHGTTGGDYTTHAVHAVRSAAHASSATCDTLLPLSPISSR